MRRYAVSRAVPAVTLLVGLMLGVLLVLNTSIFGRPTAETTTSTTTAFETLTLNNSLSSSTITSTITSAATKTVTTTVTSPTTTTQTVTTTSTITTNAGLQAQVSVTGLSIAAANFGTGAAGTITCVTSAPATPYITLKNMGTAGAQVTGVTITWAGTNNAYALTAATTCTVGAAGAASATTYAQFIATPKVAIAPWQGQAYSGTVSMSNGAIIPFAGIWQ